LAVRIRRAEPDFMAGYVVNHIPGRRRPVVAALSRSSRKARLAYSVYECCCGWITPRCSSQYRHRADRAGETVDAIEKEIPPHRRGSPTQKELDDAKSYLKGRRCWRSTLPPKLAQALLQYQLDKLPIDYIEKRQRARRCRDAGPNAKKAAKRLWGQGLLTVIVGRAPQAPPSRPPPRPRRTDSLVSDAVQRSSRCSAERTHTFSCVFWTPDLQRTTPQEAARCTASGNVSLLLQ